MSIKTDTLTKCYGVTVAVDGVNLDYDDDVRVLALIGPSGGGKSTLLRLLGGLEIPTSGQVWLDGELLPSAEPDLLPVRRQNGFLFQSFNLFPHLSARENVVLPLVTVHGWDRPQAMSRAEDLSDRFGLRSHLDKKPGQLSGGQQQRFALLRALAHKPRLLLLDEPTSALDPEMKAEVLEVIGELCQSGQRIVLSTHEMGFARETADQVVFLSEGRVIESSTPGDLFGSPRSNKVRDFLAKVMRW
jgi:polar amino acid transport system ATP-binding protein